jgi:hypothetical protein
VDDLNELRAILATKALTTAERIVLMAILLHRNGQSGRCDPSIALLTRETGLGERSVQRAIQRLQQREHLLCNRREGRSTCYSVAVSTSVTVTPPPESHPRHDDTPPPPESHPTPVTVAPKRTKERTKERTKPSGGARRRAAQSGAESGETKKKQPGWTTLAGERWKTAFGGVPNFGQIGRCLKPLIDAHGEEEVLATWDVYLAGENPTFASPAQFVAKYGMWRNGNGGARNGKRRLADVDAEDIAGWSR